MTLSFFTSSSLITINSPEHIFGWRLVMEARLIAAISAVVHWPARGDKVPVISDWIMLNDDLRVVLRQFDWKCIEDGTAEDMGEFVIRPWVAWRSLWPFGQKFGRWNEIWKKRSKHLHWLIRFATWLISGRRSVSHSLGEVMKQSEKMVLI